MGLLMQPSLPTDTGTNSKKAFDFAREVLRSNEEWAKQQEEQKERRKERDDLMKIACETSTPTAAADTGTSARVSVVAKAAGVSSDQITVIMTFPDGKQSPCSFKPSESGFEVYAKAHELGGQKIPVEMRLTGRGSSSVDRIID